MSFWNGMVLALTVLFVWMKLSDQLAWSWWWVTSPVWIGLAVEFFLLAVVVYLER